MTTTQPTSASMWEFTNQAVKALAYCCRFLKQLDSGQISQPALNVLERYTKPGPDDILHALGRGAGSTGNPAQANEHARLTRLLGELHQSIVGQFWSRVKGDDADPDSWLQTFTAEELAAIAAEYRPKLAAITKTKLEVEAEAGVAWVENRTPDGVTLDFEDSKTLRYLFDVSPRQIQAIVLAASVRLDRKTVGESLNRLESAKYVCRPGGSRSGFAITEAGKAVAKGLSPLPH